MSRAYAVTSFLDRIYWILGILWFEFSNFQTKLKIPNRFARSLYPFQLKATLGKLLNRKGAQDK